VLRSNFPKAASRFWSPCGLSYAGRRPMRGQVSAVTESVSDYPHEFDDEFERLAALAYRVARRVLYRGGDAEDVAAETMARAQVRWKSIRDHAEPWVVTVATRLAIREARYSKRHVLRATHLGGAPDGADGVVSRIDLARALRALSRRQRQAVSLRYLADLTDTEAAAAMACSVPSLRTHCARGVSSLRAQLSDLPDWAGGNQEGGLL
jgi:RNA polymerase sigma factor (sigma-70 family)